RRSGRGARRPNCGFPRRSSPCLSCFFGIPATCLPARRSSRRGGTSPMTAAALLFAVGGWLFSTALSAAQLGAIDSQLTAQLAQAARYLPGNGTGPQPATAAAPAPGEYMVQVVDSAGRVRGASPDAGTTPLLTAAELSQIRQAQAWATRTIDEEDTRITAAPLAGHPGLVAVAAVSLETYDATQRQAL